jgi:hypothetical protein
VYTIAVKNITLSADDELIRLARERAREQNTTLNAEFRRWLEDYTGRQRRVEEFRALMKRLSHVRTDGRRFTRDEMHERR